MQSANRNKVILVLIILLPVVISLMVFVFISSRNSSSEEYFDSGSGETVSNPKNKTPELFGVDSDEPLFLGFSKLVNAGLTTRQLELVKATLGRFSITGNRQITELSVTVDTIEQTIGEGSMSLTFDLTGNREIKYLCTVRYAGLDDAQIVILDGDGKQIFDSNVQ